MPNVDAWPRLLGTAIEWWLSPEALTSPVCRAKDGFTMWLHCGGGGGRWQKLSERGSHWRKQVTGLVFLRALLVLVSLLFLLPSWREESSSANAPKPLFFQPQAQSNGSSWPGTITSETASQAVPLQMWHRRKRKRTWNWLSCLSRTRRKQKTRK